MLFEANLSPTDVLSDKLALDNIRFSTILPPPPDTIYRQAQAGRWADSATWEVLIPPSTVFVPASEAPTPETADSIVVNDELILDVPVSVNELTIAPGGLLDLSAQLTLLDTEGVELDVQGTLRDHTRPGDEIVFQDGATWQLRDSAFYVKTADSDAIGLCDHYEEGIDHIPRAGAWVYRYLPPGEEEEDIRPAILEEPMTYPTLIFDNAGLNAYDKDILDQWDSRDLGGGEPEIPEGSIEGSAPRIKGDLIVSGWDLFLNPPDEAAPLVEGGLFVDSDALLTNAPRFPNLSQTGSGLSVAEDVRVDGQVNFTALGDKEVTYGALTLNGVAGQRIFGATDTLRLRSLILDNPDTEDSLRVPLVVQDSVLLQGVTLFQDETDVVYDRDLSLEPPGLRTAPEDKPAWRVHDRTPVSFRAPLGAHHRLVEGAALINRFRPASFQSFTYNIGLEDPFPITITKDGRGNPHLRVSLQDAVLENGNSGSVYVEGVLPVTWAIEQRNSSPSDATYTVEVQWDPGTELPGFNEGAAYLARYEDGWIPGEVVDLQGSPTPYALSMTDLTLEQLRGGLFAVFSEAAMLPVEFNAFYLTSKEEGVELRWSTASEQHNAFFDIQRAGDDYFFRSIGRQEGAGTTTEPQHYAFLDRSPAAGVNYYRLRQVDVDGAFHFSPIRSTAVGVGETREHVRPNPARDRITVVFGRTLSADTEIILCDVAGREVIRSRVQAGASQVELALPSAMARGLYVLRWQDERGERVLRVVRQ